MLQNGRLIFCSQDNKMEDQVSPSPPMDGLMWSPANVKDHQLTKFRQLVNEKYQLNLEDYSQLHSWSCTNYHQFWGQVWNFCNVISSQEAEHVVDTKQSIDQIPKWFPGAKLNYAENLLR